MTNPQPEPSMEEILASIRRIISEDEEGETAPKVAAKAPQPMAPPRPSQAPQQPSARPALILDPSGRPPEEDRAGLTLKTEDVEMFKKSAVTAMTDDGEEEVLTNEVATAASKAFQTLSQSVRVSRGEGRTLEDMVTDMLRPMVKEWLDANLPQIVEEKVEEEVQRIARRRG